MEAKPIAIIGAGISGIASAIKLAENGEKVLVIEARPFVGGRFFSFWDNSINDWVDNGQHAMAGAYDNFFDLLKKLENLDCLYKPKALLVNLYSSDGRKDILDTYSFSGKAGMLFGLMKMKHISLMSKLQILKFVSKLQFNLQNIYGITVMQLLRNEKQGKDAIYWFWEPLVLATMNLPSSIASAEIFVNILRKAFFGSKGKSSLIFSTVPFFELLSTFRELLELNGGKLMLNSRVKKIIIENYNAKAIVLNDNRAIDVKAIITTIQPYQLLKLLDRKDLGQELFKILENIEYSSIISAYYWLENDIFEEDYVALLDSIPQWVFNLSRIYSKGKKEKIEKEVRKYAVTISNANDIWYLSNHTILELCWKEIGKIFHIAKTTTVLKSKIVRERNATIMANPQIETIRKKLQNNPVRNLIIAGDWTTKGFPATLESASISGNIASEKVLNKK